MIDSHTHIGKNNLKASVKDLLNSMDEAKIDKAIVFANNMNDSCSNEYLLKQIKSNRDRLFPVAAYNHNNFFKYIDFKKTLQDGEFVGVKFYTGYEHFYPIDLYTGEDKTASSLFHNPLQLCSELNLPAIFHCGDCLNTAKKAKLKYAHPLHIDEVAVDYDDVTFVIAHMGYPWHRDAAEVCFKNKNVFADISGFVYGNFSLQDRVNFIKVLKEFEEVAGGTDKLLFGTDFPVSNQKDYVQIVSMIFGSTIDNNVNKVFNIK